MNKVYKITSIFFIVTLLFAFVSTEGVLPSRGECPPSSFTETWLYHNESGRCYRADTQGPCEEMMIYFQHPQIPTEGICECDDILRPGDRNVLPEYCIWKRPKIYWPAHTRCYSAFHQGPCRDGEWLVLDKLKHPACEPNPCEENESDDPESRLFWFTHDERCYHTFTFGYCTFGRFIVLSDRSWTPVCSQRSNKRFRFYGINDPILHVSCPAPESFGSTASQIECRPGRKINVLTADCLNYK